jgi:predicted DNA-binding ribbon-helix-helix protein
VIRLAEGHQGEGAMKSPVIKRSVVLAGHKTSVSLEEPFWQALKDIAATLHKPLCDLINSIDTQRQHGNLSSDLRLFALNHYQTRAA